MKSKRKLLVWGFFLLTLGLILFFTLQNTDRSGRLSEHMLNSINRFVRRSGLYKHKFIYLFMIDYVQFRKLAHVAEYFLLGASAMLLFRKSEAGFLKAVGCCAGISFLDQSLKLFIPGREFDWTDFPYDIAGYLLGTLLVLLIVMIRARRKREKAQQ